MEYSLFICKIVPNAEKKGYVILMNEKPKQHFKKWKKMRNNWLKNYCDNPSLTEEELDLEYRNRKLISYEEKHFDCITIRIAISKEAKDLRAKTENKEYSYVEDNNDWHIDYGICTGDLFDVASGHEYDENEVKNIADFINDKSNLIVLKRIRGQYIFLYYIYSKEIKYTDVIHRIEKDFNIYKDSILVLNRKNKYHLTTATRIDFTQVKNDKFLFMSTKPFDEYDLIWLKIKLKNEMKLKENNIFGLNVCLYEQLDIHDYLDLTTTTYQIDNDFGGGSEIVLMSEKEREMVNHYNEMMAKKYGVDVTENGISDDYVVDADDMDNIPPKEPVLHVVSKNGKIIFENLIEYEDVPKHLYVIGYLMLNEKEITVKDYIKSLEEK